MVEDERGQNHAAASFDLSGGTAPLDKLLQFAINRNGTRLAVLGVLYP